MKGAMGSVDAMKLKDVLNKAETPIFVLQGLQPICATETDKNLDVLGHIGLVVVHVPKLLDLPRRALDYAGKLWKR